MDNREYKNMSKSELIKEINNLRTKINLYKATESYIPINLIIDYSTEAMSRLNYTEEKVIELRNKLLEMATEKNNK